MLSRTTLCDDYTPGRSSAALRAVRRFEIKNVTPLQSAWQLLPMEGGKKKLSETVRAPAQEYGPGQLKLDAGHRHPARHVVRNGRRLHVSGSVSPSPFQKTRQVHPLGVPAARLANPKRARNNKSSSARPKLRLPTRHGPTETRRHKSHSCQVFPRFLLGAGETSFGSKIQKRQIEATTG